MCSNYVYLLGMKRERQARKKEEDTQSSSQEQVDLDQTVVSGVVKVFNNDEMIEYQDRYITISFGPDDGYWQSDFSLPVDAPSMLNVNVVE